MKNSKLIYGFGFNDKTRPASINSKNTKEYDLWRTMLRRCYSDKFHTKQPTYIDCTASDNFKNYSYFHDWCNAQIGFGRIDANNRHWQMDKDILIRDNKVYSEDTCVFIPSEINTFFCDCRASRGESPLGVYFNKSTGKYLAHCAVNSKTKHLGFFSTPEEAFSVYKQFKESLCKELATKWRGQIDNRVYDAMMAWNV